MTKDNMKTLQEQSEIVKQRLHYHFAKVGGGWNIEHMNAPFMKEFLNEVQRLCALSDVVATETDFQELRNQIFKEELEKRLPSEDEIYKQAVLECNPFLPDSAKWLIQYLKK